MEFITDLAANRIFMASVTGWFIAQVLKTLINLFFTKKFEPERLVGSGGMPSSHSSTVCALATAAAYQYGAGSFEFAISAIFAIVVMYDAIGVRRETGVQAILLNKMLDTFSQMDWGHFNEEKLKELVGHTPIQVLAGAILGIAIAVAIH